LEVFPPGSYTNLGVVTDAEGVVVSVTAVVDVAGVPGVECTVAITGAVVGEAGGVAVVTRWLAFNAIVGVVVVDSGGSLATL
jgi:hypothetical protein